MQMRVDIPEGAYISILSKEQLLYNLEYHLKKHPEDIKSTLKTLLDSNELPVDRVLCDSEDGVSV